MTGEKPIPVDEWRTIVRNVPIVSVDLVIHSEGSVLLGKRTNEPAKGEWFVPGGAVLKGERLAEAVHRIARGEVDVAVEIERRLGVYEHHYDVADVDGVDEKHYVPVGYLVSTSGESLSPDDQHAELRWFDDFDGVDLHPYVEAYLRDAALID